MAIKKTLDETVGNLTWWREMITIVVGCIICAAGFVFFINPYNIVPGGVYGLGIVLHNIFPSIQVGTFGYMFDIPLLTIAIILFGKQFGGRTLFAAATALVNQHQVEAQTMIKGNINRKIRQDATPVAMKKQNGADGVFRREPSCMELQSVMTGGIQIPRVMVVKIPGSLPDPVCQRRPLGLSQRIRIIPGHLNLPAASRHKHIVSTGKNNHRHGSNNNEQDLQFNSSFLIWRTT